MRPRSSTRPVVGLVTRASNLSSVDLPGAVAADDAEDFARFQFKTDAFQGPEVGPARLGALAEATQRRL